MLGSLEKFYYVCPYLSTFTIYPVIECKTTSVSPKIHDPSYVNIKLKSHYCSEDMCNEFPPPSSYVTKIFLNC